MRKDESQRPFPWVNNLIPGKNNLFLTCLVLNHFNQSSSNPPKLGLIGCTTYLLGDKSKTALTILIFLFLLNSLNWSPPWFRIVSPLLQTNFKLSCDINSLFEVETVETLALAFFALTVLATDGVNCLSLLFHSFPSCLSQLFVTLFLFL